MEKTNKPVRDRIESTRRGFLQWGTGILTVLCGLAVGIPLVGPFIGPAFRPMKTNWIKVAGVGTLPTGTPISLSATDVQVDAFVHESVIRHLWAIKNSETEITVFSPICPHLGCQYNWNPTSGHFECPCHGSVYAPDGTVLGGPAPRRLDTLPTKIENGELYVEWMQFKSGTPEKILV